MTIDGAGSGDRVMSGRRLEEDLELTAEVVVIGTGAGGAVVARELAAAGMAVVVIEEGPYLRAQDFAHLGPLDATRLMYRDMGLTAGRGTPPVMVPMGRAVGGTTLINLGTALRMEPEHFEHWQRAGLERIGWDDLAAAYDRVEELSPRSAVPEAMLGGNTRVLREGARALGLDGHVLDRYANGCRGTGRCFIGCPTDGKKALHLSYVPAALEAGARLITDCRADRIVAGAAGIEEVRAVGLAPGERPVAAVTIRAPRVVVACGALLSPILLHRSGFGRSHPDSGRHLGIHPACRAIGVFDEPVDGHRGVPQAFHVPPADDREIYLETVFLPPALMAPTLPRSGTFHRELMRDYRHLALMGFRFIETHRGSVRRSFRGLPLIDYDVAGRDLETLKIGLLTTARLLFEAGARRVLVPVAGFDELGGPDDLARFEAHPLEASRVEVSGYHAHGTLRMGSDPACSVVGEDGAHHGVPGLYVADASVFPTSSRVNPQHTVMALATLIARGIAAGR